MKFYKYFITTIILALFTGLNAFSKTYREITVGLTTTVHLIFPSDIISYDVGLGQVDEYPDILADQPSDNRLKLAAGIENFTSTNLFVETQEAYYNFILRYDAFPKEHIINLKAQEAVNIKHKTSRLQQQEKLVQDSISQKEKKVKDICQKVYKKPESSFIVANKTLGVSFQLDNIYVDHQKLFFKFSVNNQSNVKYEVGYLGYLISEKGKGKKKGVVTDQAVEPVYTYQDFTDLNADDKKIIVSVFDKFTVQKGKYLFVHLWEKEGERMIEIRISPKQIVNAKIL